MHRSDPVILIDYGTAELIGPAVQSTLALLRNAKSGYVGQHLNTLAPADKIPMMSFSGTQLKRVILMSSMATLRPIVHTDGVKTFGEVSLLRPPLSIGCDPHLSPSRLSKQNDWNDVSAAEVQKLGNKTHPADKYAASKVLAERAAWKFVVEEHVAFDLVTIHPSYVSVMCLLDIRTRVCD